MSLVVEIRHRQGPFTLDVGFHSAGGLTALLGRSGAGKTSLVNIIGGLERPDQGRVAINGETLVDTEHGVFVPPHRRRLGYVFQEGRLFPHLTVRQNLLYGHWFAPRAERYGGLDEVVALLGIGTLLDRRPATLSGGEKQRVAIGRALLASPRLLLMDEPLASLDEGRKSEILPYIERLRDETGIPIVYVSHSIPEVARLANTVVVLSDGKVVAAGPTGEVMSRVDLFPATGRAEAGVMLDAVVSRHDGDFELTVLEACGGELTVPRVDLAPGTPARIWVRARDVMLAVEPPSGLSALNILAAVVSEVSDRPGPIVDIGLDCAGAVLRARLTRRSVVTLGLAPGRQVYAVIKSISFGERSLSEAPAGPRANTGAVGDAGRGA